MAETKTDEIEVIDEIIELQDAGNGFAAQILIEELDVDEVDIAVRRIETKKTED